MCRFSQPLFQLGFGKRPREELYSLIDDPSYMTNLAADAAYEPVRARMESRLLAILKEQADPRLMEQPCRYEYEPYAGPTGEETTGCHLSFSLRKRKRLVYQETHPDTWRNTS